MDAFRTLIVPAANVQQARNMALLTSPTAGTDMWTTPLSPSGTDPATYYVSTGCIGEGIAAMMPCSYWTLDENGQWVAVTDPGDPAALAEFLGVPEADVLALTSVMDISDQDPFVAMDRLGIQMIVPPAESVPEAIDPESPTPESNTETLQ